MNTFYSRGRQAFATAEIDWPDDDVNVNLVDTGDYTVDVDTHDFFDDVPSGAIVASAALANKTATGGILAADNVTFTEVTGDECEALVINKDTGNDATSVLILYLDTATGLPVTPNGGDLLVAWNTGPYKIARL